MKVQLFSAEQALQKLQTNLKLKLFGVLGTSKVVVTVRRLSTETTKSLVNRTPNSFRLKVFTSYFPLIKLVLKKMYDRLLEDFEVNRSFCTMQRAAKHPALVLLPMERLCL